MNRIMTIKGQPDVDLKYYEGLDEANGDVDPEETGFTDESSADEVDET